MMVSEEMAEEKIETCVIVDANTKNRKSGGGAGLYRGGVLEVSQPSFDEVPRQDQ